MATLPQTARPLTPTQLASAGVAALVAGTVMTAGIGIRPALPGYLVLTVGLTAVTVTDLRQLRIPTAVIAATLAGGTPWLVADALATNETHRLAHAALLGAAGYALFAVFWLVAPSSIGYGDVRLAGLIATFTGWADPNVTLTAIVFAWFLGAGVGLGLIITGRATRRTALPFAPALAAGAIFAVGLAP